MTMLARIEAGPDSGNRRYSRRRLLKLQVPGTVPNRPGALVLIHDLSLSGLLIETSADLAVGTRLEVELPEVGASQASVVWSTGRFFGCQFEAAIPVCALSAAQLMTPAEGEPASARSAEGPTRVAAVSLPPAARLRFIGALALGAWALVLIPIALAAQIIS